MKKYAILYSSLQTNEAFMHTRLLLTTLLAVTTLFADKIVSTTVACPSVEALEKLQNSDMDFKEKNLFLMREGCRVLAPKEKIHVLTPTAACCGKYLRISIDKTSDIMYVDKGSVYVEQPGDKNILRF
jgi:hypothetical protein